MPLSFFFFDPNLYLEEEDVLAIIRLVKRLDENGHIKPLEASQNKQLS